MRIDRVQWCERGRKTFQEEGRAWMEPPTPIASERKFEGADLKWLASRKHGKQVFRPSLLRFTFSQAPPVRLDRQTGNTGFRFSSILLPLTLELQATSFLEPWMLFELKLKLEMCFESHCAGVFISSVYDTYRWTRWLTTQRSKHRSLENPEPWELAG